MCLKRVQPPAFFDVQNVCVKRIAALFRRRKNKLHIIERTLSAGM